MDNDEYERNPDFEANEIHAPFFTNKEHGFKYDVHYFDYVYLFVNQYHLNLRDTFKLIDYSNKINLSCFVVITNCVEHGCIDQIESYLKYSKLNYIIFKLKNVYMANHTEISHNHDIAMLMHQIMKQKENLNEVHHFKEYYDILHFEDAMKYIAASPFHQHVLGQTFHIQSKQHNYSFDYLMHLILKTLNINSNDTHVSINQQEVTDLSSEYNKFECYFKSAKMKETPIESILKIISNDLEKDKDIISRKSDFERFDKSAVLCDDRYDEDLVRVVLNFMINLDPSWQFELFVGDETISLWK